MRVSLSLVFLLFVGHGFFYAQAPDTAGPEAPHLIGVSSKLQGATKLYFVPGKEEKLFILTFHNPDSPNRLEAENVLFYGNDEDLEDLYLFLKEGFSSRENRIFQINEKEKIKAGYAYSSLLVTVMRKEGLDGWFFLSKVQLERLFGKR